MKNALPPLYLRKGNLTTVKPPSASGRWAWPNVRNRLGRSGWVKPGQEVHHWLIPRKGWGKHVPGWIKNRKWNLMRMPSQKFHHQVHGWGSEGFGMAGRLWHGSPFGAKIAGPPGAAAGGAGLAYMFD